MGEEPRDERRLGSAGARVEAAIEGDDEEFDFGQDGENLAAECRLVIARGGGGVGVAGSVSGFGHPGSFILRLAACAGRRVRRVARGAGSGGGPCPFVACQSRSCCEQRSSIAPGQFAPSYSPRFAPRTSKALTCLRSSKAMAPKARSAKRAIDHLEGRCQGTASKKRATKTKATRTRAPAPTRVRYRTYALVLGE